MGIARHGLSLSLHGLSLSLHGPSPCACSTRVCVGSLRHVAITALVAHAINAQAELEVAALRQATDDCDGTTTIQRGITRKPTPTGSRPRVHRLADLMVGQPPSTAYRSVTVRGSMIRKLRSSTSSSSSFIRPLRSSTSREGDTVRVRRLVAFSPEYRHIKLASTDVSVFDDVSSTLEQSATPYSRTPLLPYSPTPLLPYSHTPILPYSRTPVLPNSQTPVLPYSRTPILP